MNENVQKWVAALRSGEYKQAQRKLTDRVGYCCLGVACDVFMKETGKGEWLDDGGFAVDGYYDRSELPQPVLLWLGLNTVFGGFYHADDPEDGDALTEMNDHGASFDDIASIIESTPPGLFAHSPTEGTQNESH